MTESFDYCTNSYFNAHPNYHLEDAQFKASNFQRVLCDFFRSNPSAMEIDIKSVVDVGCGVGGVLGAIVDAGIFEEHVQCYGWDLSSSAIKQASSSFPAISFFAGDFISQASGEVYDLVLCADVIEHVHDVYGFMKSLKEKGKLFLFNIPLDIALVSLLLASPGQNYLNSPFLKHGHIHFFTYSSALVLLEASGFEVLSASLARNGTMHYSKKVKSLKGKFYFFAQRIVEVFSPVLSSALFGDSLIVLARPIA